MRLPLAVRHITSVTLASSLLEISIGLVKPMEIGLVLIVPVIVSSKSIIYWYKITNCFVLLVADCGPLTIANGNVDTPSGTTTFNNTATYSCDPGYDLNGEMTRTCNASEVWTPDAPTCDRKFESSIPLIAHWN